MSDEFNLSDWLIATEVSPEEARQFEADQLAAQHNRRIKRKRQYRKDHPDYVLREQQRCAAGKARNHGPEIFKGVDCEGAPGRVRQGERIPLVLIRAGNDYLAESEADKGISWNEALDWLCHRSTGFTYVAFAFNYDVWSILGSYPDKRKIVQLVKKGMAYFTIGNIGWIVWHISRKRFKVVPIRRCRKHPSGWCSTRKTCKYCGREIDETRGQRFAVSDVFTNFQCSFVKAINDWKIGTEAGRCQIENGKDNLREDIKFYDPAEISEVIEYNWLECEYLASLMTEFSAAWLATKLPRPRNWEGPASLAKRTFESYQVPKSEEIKSLGHIPDAVRDAAMLAMYGGWFETRLYGPVSELITEYDKTSAYPDAATHLPCLRHHHWEQRAPKPGEYALQVCRATYDRPVTQIEWQESTLTIPDYNADPNHPQFMGLPHRDKSGRISRPLNVTGWYWNFEIAEARHQKTEILDSWVMVPDECGCKYDRFAFIFELFRQRQMLGKRRGKPLKLGLNSMYGIMAERQRGNSAPPYTNYIAASFITAWTRASIMRTIHEQTCERDLQCGVNVVMVATDAVFFIGQPDIPSIPVEEKEKAQLGEWTRETFTDGLFIVQGGIYWPPGSDQTQSKTRGVPASMLAPHVKEFEKAYKVMVVAKDVSAGVVTICKRMRPDGKIVDAIRFIGGPDAVNRNAWDELGTFQPFSRGVGFDWSAKRALLMQNRYSTRKPLETLPKAVDDPVSKSRESSLERFGNIFVPACFGPDDRRALVDDTPDWLPILRATSEDEGFSFGRDE